MTLIAKTTNIPTSATIKANNVDLTKVVANNVTVWEKVVFTSKEFPYNGTNGTDGSVQEWEVPVDGTYLLEVYGAEGGNTHYLVNGSSGGYAKGTKYLTAGTKLYICVGGRGSYTNFGGDDIAGGYNGGGGAKEYKSDGCQKMGYSGGGATHIALGTNRGELKNYVNNKSEILIVAGGAGGAGMKGYDDTSTVLGGVGGGLNGGNGANLGYNGSGKGGTQTTAGTNGGFGYGGTGCNGGGGGWYGGANGNGGEYEHGYPAGGGSGYIGGVSSGTMSNGVRSGHGYAKITLL